MKNECATSHSAVSISNAPRCAIALLALLLAFAPSATAGPREQARRMHDRLAGVPPTAATLDAMAALLASGQRPDALAAAGLAMQNSGFYNVTVKQLVTPWTNKDQTVFAPLNDYTATVIGMVRDGVDFRQVLYGDILYVGTGAGVPAYSLTSNSHYEALDTQRADLSDPARLVQRTQTSVYGSLYGASAVPAPAGVLTTRAAAKAFLYAGTNRAMFRFTFLNHLCNDLEALKDVSRPPDHVRQDVARSPGGDSRIFLNNCVGCHAGMDGLGGAFAYYDYEYNRNTDPDGYNGRLLYTPNQVASKYLINADNFKYGYVTADDSWINYWRTGVNANLGWADNDPPMPSTGNGARAFGQELANTEAFAQCQVKKVFKAVCFREPSATQLTGAVSAFKASGYQLKSVFAEAAAECKGE